MFFNFLHLISFTHSNHLYIYLFKLLKLISAFILLFSLVSKPSNSANKEPKNHQHFTFFIYIDTSLSIIINRIEDYYSC